jgi:NaMN:DMB phosphoribosyltransferase
MSPHKTNKKSGGSFGRAASGTALRCDAARADNVHVLVGGFAVMACAVTVLALNAPDLWPQLFLR